MVTELNEFNEYIIDGFHFDSTGETYDLVVSAEYSLYPEDEVIENIIITPVYSKSLSILDDIEYEVGQMIIEYHQGLHVSVPYFGH